MKTLYRYIIVLVLLLAAIASYSIGSSKGLFVFILLGFIFEAGFWFGLFPIKRDKANAKDSMH